jgi:hypothetical protein
VRAGHGSARPVVPLALATSHWPERSRREHVSGEAEPMDAEKQEGHLGCPGWPLSWRRRPMDCVYTMETDLPALVEVHFVFICRGNDIGIEMNSIF